MFSRLAYLTSNTIQEKEGTNELYTYMSKWFKNFIRLNCPSRSTLRYVGRPLLPVQARLHKDCLGQDLSGTQKTSASDEVPRVHVKQGAIS